jgi:hypothetical protein
VLFLYFESVYPTQGCDDILPPIICHNLFNKVPSLGIPNAIIGVWLFIVMFTCESNYCLIIRPLPSSSSMCG